MRYLTAIVALLGCNACMYMTPRSAVLGQTAVLPKAGQADLGLSVGAAYANEGGYSGTLGTTTTSASDQVMIPNLDGNLSYGLSELLALNIRGGATGLQPGASVAILRGDLSLTAQPQVGIGYLHSSSSASGNSTNTDYVVFTVGARVLASHSSGFYGGAGYTFEYLFMKSSATSGASSSSESNLQEHQILLGVGYEVPVGMLRLRPEISFVLVPARSLNSGSTSQSGKFSFVFAPTLTVAFRTGT